MLFYPVNLFSSSLAIFLVDFREPFLFFISEGEITLCVFQCSC
uniref:Uncharacterized protein n=1 Tax=Anguilla anguilla TaxID=7936 RepID=A0A0E9QU28_ANGAN